MTRTRNIRTRIIKRDGARRNTMEKAYDTWYACACFLKFYFYFVPVAAVNKERIVRKWKRHPFRRRTRVTPPPPSAKAHLSFAVHSIYDSANERLEEHLLTNGLAYHLYCCTVQVRTDRCRSRTRSPVLLSSISYNNVSNTILRRFCFLFFFF